MAPSNAKLDPGQIRIGVIGCGGWGSNHIRTLKAIGHLAAIADHNNETLARMTAEFDVPGYSPDDLIDSDAVDGIVLALPPEFHVQFALRVLAAGKHLLVEKPMALDLAGAQSIVDKAHETGLVAVTGHILRFHAGFEALETLVKSGGLGTVKYVYSSRLGLGKFFQKTDAFWDIAPHDLSLLLALVEGEVKQVQYIGTEIISDATDFAHLNAEFASGVRSHTFVSRLAPDRERKFTVIGDKAMAVLDDLQPWDKKLAVYRHKISAVEGAISAVSAEAEYVKVTENMPLEAELQHFVNAIATGKPLKSSVDEGLRVLKLLVQAEEQAERSRGLEKRLGHA